MLRSEYATCLVAKLGLLSWFSCFKTSIHSDSFSKRSLNVYCVTVTILVAWATKINKTGYLILRISNPVGETLKYANNYNTVW